MRHELFIYYRAPVAHADALAEAVRRLQQHLSTQYPRLDARLLRRVEPGDGDTTWMETYRLPPDADPTELTQAIESAAQVLQPLLAGPRHVEHFLPCAS